jgi:hypothetical protein
MWKNIVDPDKTHMTAWRMSIACWIPEATNTHSGCVTLNCFFTATMVARNHFSDAIIRALPVLLITVT